MLARPMIASEWRPFSTVPRGEIVYGRFADGAVDVGSFFFNIPANGEIWFGRDHEHDDHPAQWRPITDADRALAAAMAEALSGASEHALVETPTDPTYVLIDGHFDLAVAARKFLELVTNLPEAPR